MATARKRRRILDLGAQFQASCPCCFRPGVPFCDSCDPKSSADRLTGLRSLLSAYNLDAYLVTSEDAHLSEYVCSADERRSFLTGFSGSAGSALVTMEKALLWTDSRYFLQAEKQLEGSEWILMKQLQANVPEMSDWVLEHLKGKTVGVDPRLVPAELAEDWRGKWGGAVALKELQVNLVDAVWTTRPEDPCNPLQIHPLDLAGETIQSKLTRVRDAIASQGAGAILLSALDQIAWLFNLRGSDIECNPVFFAYAAVLKDKAMLFLRGLDEGKPGLQAEVQEYLSQAGVAVKPYSSFFSDIALELGDQKVFLESSSSSLALKSLVRPELRVQGLSPVEDFKACKNAVEIQGLRRACKRDSVALCELLATLRRKLCDAKPGEQPVNEVDVSEMMTELRSKQPLYVGDSFPTISSSGSNSAVVHYQPERENCKTLSQTEMYLIDTGGQYKDGTTDVTRTMHFGSPTAEQKRFYTRVLQGAHAAFVLITGG
ncbi:unnamed protein product [Effrenium voratum]|uniref:Uncharacterized protein n=1 Tax=Effrenium voratum TaxID=2562239 RepID=A0AA36JJJ5_9DINO|nr:unnamed protein product [Effrenium voratum]CAJ1406859.1 unnamed protein product [Effrenium voratum]